MHCLLVEVTFLTVHAEHRCDNLPKLHDFTLHRLLVKVKFLRAHALPAGGSHISYGARDNLPKLHHFTLHRLLVEAKFLTAHVLPAVQIL